MRVVLADDSVLLREGVARLLADAGFEVIGQAGDPEELLRLVRLDPPDVAVVDIRMPPTHSDEGLQAAQAIHSEFPHVGVLVLSQYLDSGYAMRVISGAIGARGYLLKDRVTDLEQFADAVRRVGDGESVVDPEVVSTLINRPRERNPLDELTEREREVLALMAEGCSNQAICERMFLSPKTIEAHVRGIFMKLDLPPAANDHRRVLAVLAYLRG